MAKAPWRETRLAQSAVRQARLERAAVLGIATNGQPIVNPVKQQRRASAVTPPPSAFAELGDRTASSRRCVDDFAQPRDLDTGASTLSRTRRGTPASENSDN